MTSWESLLARARGAQRGEAWRAARASASTCTLRASSYAPMVNRRVPHRSDRSRLTQPCDAVVLEIERCRQHISKMTRLGRQCEGAALVLQRLEHRLVELVGGS